MNFLIDMVIHFHILFIGGLANSIINLWGQFLFNILQFNSVLIILIIVITFVFILLFKIKKIKLFNFICLFILVLLTEYFTLVLPFHRGERLDYLRKFGTDIVEKIHFYENENGIIPDSIDKLYPKYINSEQLNLSQKIIRYHRIEYFNPESQKKDLYFNLNLYEDFMDIEYLSYNSKTKSFRLTDE